MYIEVHGSKQTEGRRRRGGGGGRGGEGRGGEGRGGEGRGGEGRGGEGRGGEEGTGQYTVYSHKPSHNAALALETLVLQMKTSEQV